MSILASEIVVYASVGMPTDDSASCGGAIDPKNRVAFTQLAANDDIEVVSSVAGDTQNCTIVARDAAGAITTQTLPLTGVTAKIFSGLGAAGVVERVLSVALASDAAGTITVRRSPAGATIAQIPVGERGFTSLFQRCASDPSVAKTFYSKVFVKNNNGSLALLGATIVQNADASGKITHALANAVNDTNAVANRITAPAAGILASGGAGTFDDTSKALPTVTDLAAGAAIGVWLKLSLIAGDAALKSTYTLEVDGSST